MAAPVPDGTDQSSRASPPVAVSPDTPALMTVAAMPLALSVAASLAGKAASSDEPKPAVNESPSATICTGRSSARTAGKTDSAISAKLARCWTARGFLPYVGDREQWNHIENGVPGR